MDCKGAHPVEAGQVGPRFEAQARIQMERSLNKTEEEQTGWRDGAYRATLVSKLKRTHVPPGAVKLNVEGRQVVGPVQGFGLMWQNAAVRSTLDAPDRITRRVFKRDPAE